MNVFQRFSRDRSEAGETLIEVLISTALMGLVVVGILGGLVTILLASSVHREQADANTVLVSAMERIKSSDVARVPCGTDPKPTYLAAARATVLPQPLIDKGWTVNQIFADANMVVSYQTLSAPSGATQVSFTGSCDDALPLQQVTITLTTPDGHVTPTLTFIKGDS